MIVCAIVQARMGSSRFPGKMLRDLAGKPLIWHVIHRLRQCRTVSEIILATSDTPSDDALARYTQSLGVTVIRGPEQNVLQRFSLALQETKAEIIIRITGDSPLIDPALIDRLVARLEESKADYVATSVPVSDCGIDPVARHLLERLAVERGNHPAAIEHVTGFLTVEPEFAQRAVLNIDGEDRLIEGARFSVDTPADLAFMEALYQRLGASPGEASFHEVLRLLRAAPELLAINGHVRQRRADEKPIAVLIRCDGGHRLGLGHVVRCLAIAAALRDRFAVAVTFAMSGDEAAFALVRAQGFPLQVMNTPATVAELAAILAKAAPDLVLMDLRTPFEVAEVEAVRRAGARLAVLDDPGQRRLEADLAFFPPAGTGLDWHGAKGETHIGFDFIPLRPQFSPPPAWRPAMPPLALILAGGSDPGGIGHRWLASAARALPPTWRIGLVIGAAALEDPVRDKTAHDLGRRLTIYRDVSNMAGLMAEAEIALAAFGMTAYELAAIGVPMLLLCLSEDHYRSALTLTDHHAAKLVGIAERAEDATLDRALAVLANDAAARRGLSEAARQLIDGSGALRIAERIVARAKAQAATAQRG